MTKEDKYYMSLNKEIRDLISQQNSDNYKSSINESIRYKVNNALDKLVLMIMEYHSVDNIVCLPCVFIAKRACMDIKTVKLSISRLQDLGVVEPLGKGSGANTNKYKLNFKQIPSA